jgi:hypothetical protein
MRRDYITALSGNLEEKIVDNFPPGKPSQTWLSGDINEIS